ncbi:Os08g0443150 [Oryza sativa Japonica Group]|uniref:Os08g0443150 protein n=1 Tax=Oryza sativa subsp. japonica TaxID=39947 RepID=A0A0P0XGD2_ORYSJ|nr:Os08g0443150 [Oryza sativa Japonica Group]
MHYVKNPNLPFHLFKCMQYRGFQILVPCGTEASEPLDQAQRIAPIASTGSSLLNTSNSKHGRYSGKIAISNSTDQLIVVNKSSPALARFTTCEGTSVVHGGEAAEEERRRVGARGEAAEERHGWSWAEDGELDVPTTESGLGEDTADKGSSRTAIRELEMGARRPQLVGARGLWVLSLRSNRLSS